MTGEQVGGGTGLRAALVTGASTGLGRAIALALARDGFDLAVTDIEATWLADLLAHPDLAGRRVIPMSLELRSEASIRAAFARASSELGPISLLVNNAARALQRAAVEVSWDEWDDVVNVNLKGGFFLSTLLARACIEGQRPGSVVNIASTHGLVGLAGRSVYGISKGGIIQMTRMLAIEWAAQDIRVNAVAPATVMTPSRQQMLADPARRQAMLARIPTGRFPTEEEVAAAVCYLASPGSASITGQVLVLDGGLTAA